MASHHHDDDHTVIMPLAGDNRREAARPNLTQVSSSGGTGGRMSEMFLSSPRLSWNFDSSMGLNPLVEAASHLLNEMVSLRFEEQTLDLTSLRDRLETGVRSFEVKALAAETDRAQVLAARYLLCTALDEAVSTSALGESGEWSRHALLSTFHNETWGGEKFFLVLEKCLAQPTRSLYLLELMYIILSLGFEGRYRVMDRGNITLEALRDKVYREIRFLRGDPLSELAAPLARPVEEKPPRYLSTWLVAGVAAFCLLGTFLAFSFILNQRADEVLGQYAAPSIQEPAQTAQEQDNAGDV
ncbi:hypothetical protein C4J81_14615 [Deltaproteobacteria bacterium Smac51]|nr:hypothetical protein C4J81_14615 [Deltaproteobacteria bacterium Smac51]